MKAQLTALAAVGAVIAIACAQDVEAGIRVGQNMWRFSSELIIILPLTFILVGLFEVWVNRETVERHLGANAGAKGYVLAVILGGTTVGPAIVALPVAHALYKKGAGLAIVFTYVGASAVCRIPMTLFEASCLGWPFTLIRYGVSIPLVVLSGALFGAVLTAKGFQIRGGESLRKTRS